MKHVPVLKSHQGHFLLREPENASFDLETKSLISPYLHFIKVCLIAMPHVMKVDSVWTSFVEAPHPPL